MMINRIVLTACGSRVATAESNKDKNAMEEKIVAAVR